VTNTREKKEKDNNRGLVDQHRVSPLTVSLPPLGYLSILNETNEMKSSLETIAWFFST
jgi:hypothetical protein